MSNSTLGNFTFDAALGAPAHTGVTMQEIRRPGVDGVGYLECAYYPERWQLTTTDYFSSNSNAVNAFLDFKSSQGAFLSYSDPLGENWGKQAILSVVMSQPIQKVLMFTGGVHTGSTNTAYKLSCTWTLQYAGA